MNVLERLALRNASVRQRRPLPLAYYGDPVLKRKSQEVGAVDDDIRELAARMLVTMDVENGIGLAAPQVGRNLRLITVATHSPKEPLPANASVGEMLLCPQMPLVLINPQLEAVDDQLCGFDEGCLSVPELTAEVVRPVRVRLCARLLNGETVDVICGGLLARCLQHELDHLEGILFVERTAPEQQQQLELPLTALAKRTQAALQRRNSR